MLISKKNKNVNFEKELRFEKELKFRNDKNLKSPGQFALGFYFSDISLIDKKRNYFTTTLRIEPSLMRMMLRPF